MKKAITFIILAAMLLVFPLSVAAATRTENINSFIAQKGDWFDPSVVESVKTKLAGLSETAFTTAINEDHSAWRNKGSNRRRLRHLVDNRPLQHQEEDFCL
jgi:hypothetical protein